MRGYRTTEDAIIFQIFPAALCPQFIQNATFELYFIFLQIIRDFGNLFRLEFTRLSFPLLCKLNLSLIL